MRGKFHPKKSLPILVMTFALSSNPWANAEEMSQSPKTQALSYLATLQENSPFFVWPTVSINYEEISDGDEIANAIAKYKKIRHDAFNLYENGTIAQISVLDVNNDTFESDIKEKLSSSHLIPSYKSFIEKLSLGKDGCTSYRFISRNTWLAVGVLLIDKNLLSAVSPNEYENCIYTSLDYVSGFPVGGEYFDYKDLPGAQVRGLVMAAIRQCSNANNNPLHRDEITKDGIVPLPSKICVVNKIKELDD